MALVIPTNVASLDSQKALSRNSSALGKSFARLSSGFRINTAADDAAGLAVSESMKAQIRSYTMAERNSNDAISMTQTAEAALGEVHDILSRMRELSVQSANGSLTSVDRGYLNTEFNSLKSEITRIEGSSKFNGQPLLGAAGTTITFQVGLDNVASDQIALTFGGINLGTVASGGVADVSLQANAQSALATIDAAIGSVSSYRSKFGAAMNRLDVTIANIQTMRLNISAANSRIRDVDVAEETSQLARNQVLSQAGTSVLAQANQLPNMAMQLLQH